MNKTGMPDVGAQGHVGDEKLASIKESVKSYVDQGAQRVDALKSKVVEAKDQAFTRGSDLLDRVTALIRENPIKAVGIAFVAGYLGMRLLRR